MSKNFEPTAEQFAAATHEPVYNFRGNAPDGDAGKPDALARANGVVHSGQGMDDYAVMRWYELNGPENGK